MLVIHALYCEQSYIEEVGGRTYKDPKANMKINEILFLRLKFRAFS
jgi:hypothetical protein